MTKINASKKSSKGVNSKSNAATRAPKVKLSQKARIYKAWLASGKDADPIVLRNRCKANVKDRTVTNWVNGWARGKRLPGCAKSE